MKRLNCPSGAQQKKKQKSKIFENMSLARSMLRFVQPTQTINIEALDCSEAYTATATPSKSETESGVGIDELTDIALKDGGKEGREDEGGDKINVDADSGKENADDNDALAETFENEEVCSSDVLYSDISDWSLPVPDKLRVDLVKRGSGTFQNENGPFVSLTGKFKDKTKGTKRQFSPDRFYIN